MPGTAAVQVPGQNFYYGYPGVGQGQPVQLGGQQMQYAALYPGGAPAVSQASGMAGTPAVQQLSQLQLMPPGPN